MFAARFREVKRKAHIGWARARPAVLVVLLTAAAHNPAVAAPSASSGMRYIVILETSRTMQRRSSGTLQAIKAFFDSGLKGQVQPGDQLMVWTFDEDLYTNLLPVVECGPANLPAVETRALQFVQGQRNDRRATFEKILPQLSRSFRESGTTTFLLVTSGEGQMLGTTVDDRINQAWRQWRDQQQKARMPLLTLFRTQDGKLTHWTGTPAPWPVEMPPRPAISSNASPRSAVAELRPSLTNSVTPRPAPKLPTADEPEVRPRLAASPLIISNRVALAATNRIAAVLAAPTNVLTQSNPAGSGIAGKRDSAERLPTSSSAGNLVNSNAAITSEARAVAAAAIEREIIAGNTSRLTNSSSPPTPASLAVTSVLPRSASPAALKDRVPEPGSTSAAPAILPSTTSALIQAETGQLARGTAKGGTSDAPETAQSAPTVQPDQAQPRSTDASGAAGAAPVKPKPHGFLMENIAWLALLLLALVGAGYNFVIWLRTYLRPPQSRVNLDTGFGPGGAGGASAASAEAEKSSPEPAAPTAAAGTEDRVTPAS